VRATSSSAVARGRSCSAARPAPIWSRWPAGWASASAAHALPNLYGVAEGYNTRLALFAPREGDNFVRSLSVGRAESWAFAAEGEPQPWEEPAYYRAPRAADRFPPALLHRYLDAIGIPPLDAPAWGPGGIVTTRRTASNRARDGGPGGLAPTIAALHERMYGGL
jgi:hypothetical protein